MTIPDTAQEMSFLAEADGFRAVIGRDVADHTRKAILPLFKQLYSSLTNRENMRANPARFDWALHPGGKAIIAGTQEELGLSDNHLRATKEIYRTRGNSSSASVLAVLDLLRHRGQGREHVAVASFGPGLVCEMVLLRHCRDVETAQVGFGIKNHDHVDGRY
ncbi:hypothetical protein PG996_007690 [Apiospora saccharicola]|uniref:Chalcone/stilbene synthase C-terminal domain-containing protein n=1 Tax=Apiospora saccharicola TaxID=335842 RepID=A0ABR1VBJ8_9PEZI